MSQQIRKLRERDGCVVVSLPIEDLREAGVVEDGEVRPGVVGAIVDVDVDRDDEITASLVEA